jgi:hypothetical protein
MRNTRWWLWLLLAALAVALALTIIFRWQAFEEAFIKWSALSFFVQLGIFCVLLWKLPRFRRGTLTTIGEGAPMPRRRLYRFILPTVFALPLTFYVLLPGVNESIPQVAEFSPIVIAPVLGGLMLTAAGSKRIRRITRIELISVAQKLLVATVLFILFASLFFTSKLLGLADINLNAL